MLVYMIGRVCHPEYILRDRTTYKMSRSLYKKLLASGGIPGDKDGQFLPCCEPFDPKKHGPLKKKGALSIPPKPDPLDGVNEDDIEDDDEDTDDEGDD